MEKITDYQLIALVAMAVSFVLVLGYVWASKDEKINRENEQS